MQPPIMQLPINIFTVLLGKTSTLKVFLSNCNMIVNYFFSIFAVTSFCCFCFIAQPPAISWNKLDILREKALVVCTDSLCSLKFGTLVNLGARGARYNQS